MCPVDKARREYSALPGMKAAEISGVSDENDGTKATGMDEKEPVRH